jgi:hypothetical protein
MGEWTYSFSILDFSIKWRLVVSFRPQALYIPGKEPLVLDRRLCGPQSQSGPYGEEKNLLLLPRVKFQSTSPQPVTISTEQPWLPLLTSIHPQSKKNSLDFNMRHKTIRLCAVKWAKQK